MVELPFPQVRLSMGAEIANGILVIAASALESTVRGTPETLLLGHAQPPDDCTDYLSVSFAGFRASAAGQTAAQRLSAERCGDVDYAAEIAIAVVRSGPPSVSRSRRAPTGNLQAADQRFAEELLEDAMALMYRATPAIPVFLRSLLAFPWLQPPAYTPGRLTPFLQGDAGGWMCQGTLSLPSPPPPG